MLADYTNLKMAFGSKHCEAVWYLLWYYGIPAKIVGAYSLELKVLYSVRAGESC